MEPEKQAKKAKYKGAYWCRQCNIGGSALTFATTFCGMEYAKALEEIGESPRSIQEEIPFVLENPPELWQYMAKSRVAFGVNELLKRSDIMQWLASRGLPEEAIWKYKFGWNQKAEFESREMWGLPEKLNEEGFPLKIWLPAGLIIPWIDNRDRVMRLKIRQEKAIKNKYVNISGGMKGMWRLGQGRPCFVVESELDMFAIDWVAKGAAKIIASGSNTRNPDPVTNIAVKKSNPLLICHDNDDAGRIMLKKWQDRYDNAVPYPSSVAKDIGEMIQAGEDINSFIYNYKKNLAL
jgi:hypothetical protein